MTNPTNPIDDAIFKIYAGPIHFPAAKRDLYAALLKCVPGQIEDYFGDNDKPEIIGYNKAVSETRSKLATLFNAPNLPPEQAKKGSNQR